MFLSAQAFADVRGKGIICIVSDKKDENNLDFISGYYFNKDNTATFMGINKKDSEDKIEIIIFSENYEVSLESKYVVIGNRHLLDRKTLNLHMKGNYANLFISNCSLYKSKKALMREFERHKKIQQEIYNKEIEGNKI